MMILNLLFLFYYLFFNVPVELIGQSEAFSIGVVDRIEGESAVILIEEEEEELIVPINRHTKEGKWVLLFQGNEEPLVLWSLDEYENEQRRKIENLQEKLLQKQSNSS